MSDIVKGISENIGRIVRYILPGIIILGGAGAAHPSLFQWVAIDNPWHMLALGIAAIVAGNVWFAFHRYGVHQLIDMAMYIAGRKGPAAETTGPRAITQYVDDLAKYVVNSFQVDPQQPLRQHVALRASSMHLMYITSEVSLIFSLSAEPGTFFSQHATVMRITGVIGFLVALCQNVITRRIDWYSVESKSNRSFNAPSSPGSK